MGRYYSGDIEGKFWFGVQSSSDADFFGVTGEEPARLEYYFDKDENLEDVKKGVKKCLKELGKYHAKLEEFFKTNESYNDKMLAEGLGLPENEAKSKLEWYARLELGQKILKCLEENGSCEFEAEC